MIRKLSLIFLGLISFLFAVLLIAQTTPPDLPVLHPMMNYAEANGCAKCHMQRPTTAAHMSEVVGVSPKSDNSGWNITGRGWLAARHSRANYTSTANTFCAKCHSPLQAKNAARFVDGFMANTELLPDSVMEGVTCASCHPSHTAATVLGRRLGIYRFEMDKSKPEAYIPVPHGEEDVLCLNCHVERHNEDNIGFKRMYDAGVRCIDCHMAINGHTQSGNVEKVAHDFKVAANLPYSCGVQGAINVCHGEFSVNATKAFLPYFKGQHRRWWPLHPGTESKAESLEVTTKAQTVDYLALWRAFENAEREKPMK